MNEGLPMAMAYGVHDSFSRVVRGSVPLRVVLEQGFGLCLYGDHDMWVSTMTSADIFIFLGVIRT
jgi:hypothetical protein